MAAMESGADLFVVCKHCGSEVSPYVTECPYCGNRLRRRAPKLPRPDDPPPRREARSRARDWSALRPWATLTLVAAGAALYVLVHAEPEIYLKAAILGPLRGDWWRLLSAPFVYANGGYAFVALVTLAIFGTLVERSNGPAVMLALFFGAAVAGGLVELALGRPPIAAGANGAALALLAAWAVPQLQRARAGDLPAGDLIGAAAIGLLLFAVPAVVAEASWLAGVIGLLVGAAVGAGVSAFAREA
jgi:membrane associated rhomboid family serine protease